MKKIIIAFLITFAYSTNLSTEVETELTINIEGLVKCIQTAAPYGKDVIELINLFRDGKYTESISKAISLVVAGNQLVKKCTEYLKQSTPILRNDMFSLAKCMVPYVKEYGMDEKLREAIANNDKSAITKILSGYFFMKRGKVPDACKKFV